MMMNNVGWPVTVLPRWMNDYVFYDWYSGIWEISDEGVAMCGAGFGAWLHQFHEPFGV